MHEDLRANVVPGSHNYRKAANGTSDGHADYPVPCTSEEAHGTSVAGVIAARNGNGVGMVGVAPHASLVGLNALVTEQEADKLDALVRDRSTPPERELPVFQLYSAAGQAVTHHQLPGAFIGLCNGLLQVTANAKMEVGCAGACRQGRELVL